MKILHLMNGFDCGAGGEENGRRCRRDFGSAVPRCAMETRNQGMQSI